MTSLNYYYYIEICKDMNFTVTARRLYVSQQVSPDTLRHWRTIIRHAFLSVSHGLPLRKADEKFSKPLS